MIYLTSLRAKLRVLDLAELLVGNVKGNNSRDTEIEGKKKTIEWGAIVFERWITLIILSFDLII